VRLPVASIRVPPGRRELGDLKRLAASIHRDGLRHPVVVDDDHTLVAGRRRLLACELLGWTEVDARYVGALSEAELRAIGLEEILQRRRLSPEERSRTLDTLVRVVEGIVLAERLAEGGTPVPTCPSSQDPVPLRLIADRVGYSPATLCRARQHVAALDREPLLRGLSRRRALRRAVGGAGTSRPGAGRRAAVPRRPEEGTAPARQPLAATELHRRGSACAPAGARRATEELR
jgi:hypothetical protein